MVFAGSSPITATSLSSKAHQKSGSFPPPSLPGLIGPMTLSDSRNGRRLGDVEAATLATKRVSPRLPEPPFWRAVPTTPADQTGARVDFLPRLCSFPQLAGGSASALTLSRPAQALLTLRPARSLSRPRRPLLRGSSPASYPAKPLVSYQNQSTILSVNSSSIGDSRLRRGQHLPCASQQNDSIAPPWRARASRRL